MEKLYLQLDKPYYTLNDTIWFKAYLLKASYLIPSNKSGIIYADILNDSNRVVKRFRFPAAGGLTWGNIFLNDKEFTPGTYYLAAYTKWMRNYGDSCFFKKQFYISYAGDEQLLVNSTTDLTTKNGVNMANVKLLFSDMNKNPFALKSLLLQVIAGNKQIYSKALQTGIDGSININLIIPEETAELTIVATSEAKDKRTEIPIDLNRSENTDIQFMPEGGDLVAGFPAHIGFKAIGEDGRGVNIAGVIVSKNQKQIADIQSANIGMGSVDIDVKPGEVYSAKINFPAGMTKTIPLPAVKNSGTVLSVKNQTTGDSIEVSLGETNDLMAIGNSYFLIATARGIVCYAAVVNFRNGNYLTKKIPKSLFPSGIAHFLLETTNGEPLNERIVFINRNDNLDIHVTVDPEVTGMRDSIGLKLKITDSQGNPVKGNFSLAITDDLLVKTDSLNNENILSRFLLTSDVKGYVEQPSYYFSSNKSAALSALDNLMLTQGWVNYNFRQPNRFEPEPELKISGKVVNVLNKPVKGTKVLLFSKSPSILKDTLTDNEGKFEFSRFPRIDTPVFIVQAVNPRRKSFNVTVKINDVKSPDFTKMKFGRKTPWYLNSDTVLLNEAKASKIAKQREYFSGSGHILNEVTITAKKFIKDSQNLNGPGVADQVLDERELEKLGKKTFLDVLKEKVKGFREKYINGNLYYTIDGQGVFFIVDGYNFYTVYNPQNSEDIKYYLTSHTAEDIKGIEVNNSGKNTIEYERRYCPQCTLTAFVEITTRSGKGPFISNTPGMFLYKPSPFSWPKQFYKPKYTAKDKMVPVPDFRSTIDWEPNIIIDKNGEATVSFYAADKPTTYTVIIEGTDLNGNLGYKMQKIKIGKAR